MNRILSALLEAMPKECVFGVQLSSGGEASICYFQWLVVCFGAADSAVLRDCSGASAQQSIMMKFGELHAVPQINQAWLSAKQASYPRYLSGPV